MKTLFVGHGSPMNALENNLYSQVLSNLGKNIETPKAILVISAHWVTDGTKVCAAKRPKHIYDFYGFPKKLFDLQYHATGSPELAEKITKISNTEINGQLSLIKK